MTDRPARGRGGSRGLLLCLHGNVRETIARDEFIEYARVRQYKGVPRPVPSARWKAQDVLMRLDVQGTATIRQRVPGAVTVFLAPPSLDVLVERLRQRAGDTPEQTEKRLEMALSEVERIQEFDYAVINREGQLEQTVAQVLAIVEAEKCRTGREPVRL